MESISESPAIFHPSTAGVCLKSNGAAGQSPHPDLSRSGWLKRLRTDRGSQLVEFAFSLPFLLVIVIGVSDFGKAYNLKHILTNAAREGARMVVSNPLTNANCTDSTPCSIEVAANAVQQYLTGAGLSAASCIAPNSPTSSGTLTWTYSCSSVTLTINRGYVFTATDGTAVSSTQVTLSYPCTWTFSSVFGLLVKNSSVSLPSSLTTNVVMENLD